MFQFGKQDFVRCRCLASPDFDEVESLDQLSPLPWREKEGIGLLKVQQIAKKEQQVLSRISFLVLHVTAARKKTHTNAMKGSGELLL